MTSSTVLTEKGWPLGTQAAPVGEVGVFPQHRLDTKESHAKT
jgi:hypothetical protein